MGELKTRRFGRGTPSQSRSRDRGVSLIEVMIALAVLGFGMLGVAASQLSALRTSDQSQDRMLAHGLAQQQVELFQEMSNASIVTFGAGGADPLNPIDPDPNDANAMAFNRSWTITADTPEDDVYTILVTVTWTNSLGSVQTIQLESFKSEL